MSRGVRQGRTTAGTVDKWLGREGAEGSLQAGLCVSIRRRGALRRREKAKVYGKKFAKFEKSIRKAWGKSPDLKDPRVLPDAGAVPRRW